MASRSGFYTGDPSYVSKPQKPKTEGQLYDRPRPNPFTEDWCEGYDEGLAGIDGVLDLRNPEDYWDGHKHGVLERERLDQLGSSNA